MVIYKSAIIDLDVTPSVTVAVQYCSDVRKIRGKKPADRPAGPEHLTSRHLVRSELKAIAPRRTDTTKGTV